MRAHLTAPASTGRIRRFISEGNHYRIDYVPHGTSRQLRSISVGSPVVGALAVGAVAIGALAIGALAIGRLTIGRSRIRLEIDELVVGKLRVTDVLQTPTMARGDCRI